MRINASQVIEELFPFNVEEDRNAGEDGSLGSDADTFGLSVDTGVNLESETPKAVKDGWNSYRIVSMMELNFGKMFLAAVDQGVG